MNSAPVFRLSFISIQICLSSYLTFQSPTHACYTQFLYARPSTHLYNIHLTIAEILHTKQEKIKISSNKCEIDFGVCIFRR